MASESAACDDCGMTHPPRVTLNPSPFHFLLTQERMPDVSETAAVHEFIRNTDVEIACREEAILRLQCEIAELRRRSEQHKAIIAPIRGVPPEIMAEIFLQLAVIEAETANRSYPYDFVEDTSFVKHEKVPPGLHRAPLVFGQVSRQWRAIALSAPMLWNSIFLDCQAKKLRGHIALCDMWLRRSGSLPLSIHLYRPIPLSEPSDPDVVESWQTLIETILPYAHRWGLLDLENLPSSYFDSLFGHLPDSLPVIETLSIGYNQVSDSSAPWARLRNAPKLRFLRLDNLGDTSAREWQTFPWSQLTHIDVGGCSDNDCLQILRQASAVVVCRFFVERESSPLHPAVLHSALQTLKIHAYKDTQLLLTCPQLLTLKIEKDNSDVSFHDLAAFLTRSGANIQNLTLGGFTVDDTEFATCLAAMPRLQHLHISEHGDSVQFTDQVWDFLTWRSNSSPLLPDLESMELMGGTGFSHRPLVRMLKSRIGPGCPPGFVSKLKMVDLSIWRRLSRSACRRLEAFRKFGLNINVLADEDGSEGSEAEEPDEGESVDETGGA